MVDKNHSSQRLGYFTMVLWCYAALSVEIKKFMAVKQKPSLNGLQVFNA